MSEGKRKYENNKGKKPALGALSIVVFKGFLNKE